MSESSPAHIQTTVADGVLHISFARPAKKNALNRAMYTAMADAMEAARDDNAQRVVLFSGQGSAFTAGNDIADFASSGGDVSEVSRFLKILVTYPKPVVAAVHGAAVGVGTTMLLHCDLVYVGTSARLKTPFVDLGLVPEAASSFLMPRALGSVRAAQMLLLGEAIDAETAERWGIANQVVPDDALLELAMTKAKHLATRAPNAMRLAKALMRGRTQERVAETMDEEGRIFTECLTSPEAREAMMAFMQKRKPDFSKF
jgi:enoyl-CoA hydratase/carnithine racemase